MTIELLDATDTAATALHTSIELVQSQLGEFDKINAGLAAIERDHPKDVACAVTTTAGMKQAIAGRAAWREPRIAVEKVRKAAKAPVLALGRDIDSFAEDLTAKLLEGEKHYDDQIKAEEARKAAEKAAKEQAEREAFAALQSKIDAIRAFAVLPAGATAADMASRIAELIALEVSLDTFGNRAGEAAQAKQQTLERLDMMHDHALEGEATAARLAEEKAELARQRADQEAREKAERERAAAEQKAAAEKLAAERAEFERQQAQARAEQKARDDADRARRDEEDRKAREARAAEDKRIADARAELEAEQRKVREAEEARAAAARKVEQDRLDAEAAAERKRLDDEAAAARAEQQRADQAARAKAQAEARAAAKAAAKLAAAQKAGPRMLAILLRVDQAIDGAANADDLAGAMSILAPEIKLSIAEGEAA